MPLINLRELGKVGGNLATIGGAAVAGYGEDKADALKEALQQAQAQRQARKDAIDEALARKTLGKVEPGEAGYGAYQAANEELLNPVKARGAAATAQAMIAPKVAEQTALEPGAVKQATDIASAAAPIAEATHRANRVTDLATEPDKIVGGIGPTGQPQFARVGQSGAAHPIEGLSPKGTASANLPAPIAAKVGQFGEMLKKAHDLTSLTDNLDVTMGQSASRDLAEHGLHVPLFGTVPGTKGIGNAIMNHSPQYTQYQAALSPFILAAAHALSGARINQDQVEQIRKSIELAPGDFANKDVRAQKEKNLIDLINSIGGSLPADAIGVQEGQMDETSLSGLAARGYKRIKGAPTPAAGGTGDPDLDAILARHPKRPP